MGYFFIELLYLIVSKTHYNQVSKKVTVRAGILQLFCCKFPNWLVMVSTRFL